MTWNPDRLWHRHPAVTKGEDRSIGQRAADLMKQLLATWAALLIVLWFIAGWMVWNSGTGHHLDPYPWILLNLFLSCFAALQCFVLLIANKRGEQIAAEVAQHTLENTVTLRQLLEENTNLTEQVRELSEAMRDHIVATPGR
jgi:uncharacterized membrane protein